LFATLCSSCAGVTRGDAARIAKREISKRHYPIPRECGVHVWDYPVISDIEHPQTHWGVVYYISTGNEERSVYTVVVNRYSGAIIYFFGPSPFDKKHGRINERPNQAMQRTARWRDMCALSVCHPPAAHGESCTGLAVADLLSR
jgi:hypothetical protein